MSCITSPKPSWELVIDGWACFTVPHNFLSCLSRCHRALTDRTPALHLPPQSAQPLMLSSLPLFSPVSVSHLFSFPRFLPCLGLAEQAWQADSFGFRHIKATFLLWQPALSCHLIALASHFSGQPLPLDRPLSLPIMLSADGASFLRCFDTPHTYPSPSSAGLLEPTSIPVQLFFWQAIHQP